MSRSEVETLLGIGNIQRQRNISPSTNDLELKLLIERGGVLNPTEQFETLHDVDGKRPSQVKRNDQEKVTIVLDHERGIYCLDENSSNTNN